MNTMNTQANITVFSNGQININNRRVGFIRLNEKTGKRTLKHNDQVHDLTHVFHTVELNTNLAKIFAL
ncbi:hypothetical protein [Asticcacaulis endophyticus]|uniref:Uncharacterized protein n=1 Tax=Asticcacaulis endophyticus TaxID=1395890 RepID=A0A918PSA9_9CAUL|nr:hypothetical protein [Asticcacaulis endophyticus]GGZ21622.1 hypothetical protein GCM10011273_02960 [Asticcacaulis endophyticus]